MSTSAFDRYHPTSTGGGRSGACGAGGWTLDLVDHAADYLPTVERRLADRSERSAGPLDAVVYNAGMDPHERCSTGGLPGITTEVLAAREEMVFAWAAALDVPIAFALAGGYTGSALSADELTALHRLTIDAAAASHTERTCR